ncbi:aldo/keto reductase [Christensenella sp. MSJ-20]|uniref:aldo/keto reductase n=1 Tax=Christensenella sp. MSJ-20 TaxID=2841518 RepID=UPI001C75632D|nr:aldo/keto reductase [Christensenella sp. MSJ-20]
MIYKQFQDLQLSTLGMGNMRLPIAGQKGPIDREKAREIIAYAYQNGVNYFDTAYRYHDGESEEVVGEALKAFPRDTWYLATKMPGHMMNFQNGKLGFQGYLAGLEISSPAAIFEEQLKKCGVEYFDFYLLHNLNETSYDLYTNEDLGMVEYLLEEKKAGRIRHLGFSTHARPETIERFLNRYDCFEFAQIQLNYLDWTLQDAKRKYEILVEHNLPVIVMEPCRGGRLTNLDPQTTAMLKEARPNDSIASWAFRFLQNLPGVQVTLSGMSTMEQLKDNLGTFSQPTEWTREDAALINQVVATLVNLVPCTACRYCCEACPQGLDIPKLISIYNEMSFDASPGLNFTLASLTPQEMPMNCIGCGACKALCPQEIEIPEIMTNLSEAIQRRNQKKA